MLKVEIRHNGEWYGQNNFTGLLMELTSKITVARILERDDFQKRIKEGSDIQMQEIMYPLLQGYDSVALEADVELGGTDQKFNLLMGRKIQKRYNQKEQDVITVPLLVGTDGVKKMSKTYDNFIALEDKANEMYGKTMSIADELIIKYFELATDVSMEEIKGLEKELKNGANPRDLKMRLASEIVKMYHNEAEAKSAQENFINTFAKKQIPDEMPEIKPSVYDITAVLTESKICKSKSEVRQMIDQGGVKVNEEKVPTGEYSYPVKSGDIVQKGSRFFVRVK